MQHTNDLVDAVAKHRESRVFAVINDLVDLSQVIVEVNTDYFVVRHHDVIDCDFFEVENAEQHLLIAAGDSAAGFVHERA